MPHLPKKAQHRLVIYASDVEQMTGRSPRTARKLLQDIRKKNNKSKAAFVTIREFAEHSGIDEEMVRDFLAS
jgi:predicted transcriptional regulator of viral defense system